jgi:ACS family tartrate transporter-like MFS transporter
MVSMFMGAISVSTVIGSPLSTSILYMDGFLGLRGWQWVFISEAIPARILSVVTGSRDDLAKQSQDESRHMALVVHGTAASRHRLAGRGGLPAKISHVLPLLLESRD